MRDVAAMERRVFQASRVGWVGVGNTVGVAQKGVAGSCAQLAVRCAADTLS